MTVPFFTDHQVCKNLEKFTEKQSEALLLSMGHEILQYFCYEILFVCEMFLRCLTEWNALRRLLTRGYSLLWAE